MCHRTPISVQRLENRMPDDEFLELFERVRCGDADAACAIVRRYEPAIRMAVRTRLTDPAMRRQFDSIDVCQSVLGSFFLHAATGAYELHEPRQLMALLVKMAQNKLAMHVRGQHRARRDVRRSHEALVEWAGIASTAPDPSRYAAGKDLLQRSSRHHVSRHPCHCGTTNERRIVVRHRVEHGWHAGRSPYAI